MSSYNPPRVIVPIFNPENYQESQGISLAFADGRYVRLIAPSQTINGNLGVSGSLTSSLIRVGNGSTLAPSVSFTNASNYGMWYDPTGATSLNFSNGGSNRISITPTSTIVNGDLQSAGTLTVLSGGSGSAPNLRFSTSSNTGMFFASSNLNIVLAASTRILITTSNTQFTNPILAPSGAVTGPGYGFTSAANSGMYLTGSGGTSSLSLAVNGTQRLLMDNSNNVLLGNTLRAGTSGTATNPWYTFNQEATMGMYRITTNNLGFACGGAEQLRLTNTGTQIGVDGTVMTFHRRLAPTATITLNSNTSGTTTIPLGVTLLNTNYDVHINIISISGPADHMTYAYDTLTTTDFRVVYRNNGSGSCEFSIQCYISGW